MFGYGSFLHTKQFRNLLLSEPHGIKCCIKPHFH